jgi:pimeloyl-ACP methyl ester carboxylesterase
MRSAFNRTGSAPHGMSEERSIDFTWAWAPTTEQARKGTPYENPTTNASDNIGDRATASSGWYKSGMSIQQWQGVDKLRRVVDDLRTLIQTDPALSGEEINIVAHSQGTLITLAALQEGLRVDNVIFMGSPMDQGIVQSRTDNTDWTLAVPNAGHISNFWSRSDDTAGYKGGIGAVGLPANTIGISGRTTDHQLSGVDHYGPTGWWAGNWLNYSVDPFIRNRPAKGRTTVTQNPAYNHELAIKAEWNFMNVAPRLSSVFYSGTDYTKLRPDSATELRRIQTEASTYIQRP